MDTQLINTEQLSRYLAVPKKTVYAWVRQKKIPHVRLVGRVLFDRKDIEQWIEEQKIAACGSQDRGL